MKRLPTRYRTQSAMNTTASRTGVVVMFEKYARVAGEASGDAAHLVMTHSHAVDLEIVAAVLARPHGHCGLIGSATKRALFERRLRERGIPGEAIRRLVCPIGLPGLRDKRPAAIAASVAAQMLLLEASLPATRKATPRQAPPRSSPSTRPGRSGVPR